MKKSTILLIIIFVILAITVYLYIIPEPEKITSYDIKDLGLKIDSAYIAKIEIKRDQKSIILENKNGEWFITSPINYPADEIAVNTILSSASKLKILSLISTNPAKQSVFQVDSATGTILNFHDKRGKNISFIIGKMGPTYMDAYIKPIDLDEVYLSEGIQPWIVSKELNDWRDKNILNLEKDSIKEITFEFAKDIYTIRKLDEKWYIDNDTIEKGKLETLLNQISNLRTENFVDSAIVLTQPQLNLYIKEKNFVSVSLIPSVPDSSKYYVKSSTSQQLFQVSRYIANQLLKKKKELLN